MARVSADLQVILGGRPQLPKRAYQYVDLCRIVPILSEHEFSKLVEILGRYRFEAAAYFVLRRLEPSMHVKIPGYIRDFLDKASRVPSTGLPADHNDYGDHWPRIWGER